MSAPNHRGENPIETVQDGIRRTVFETYLPDGTHVPPKAIAAGMNIPVSRLYEMADETRPVRLAAEEVESLTRAARMNFAVLDIMERGVGRIAFEVPLAGAPGALLTLSAESAERFGQFLQDIVRFNADGVWTREELEKARRRRDQLFAVVSATIEQAEHAVNQKGRVA
jgi:hypothetical protein